MRGNNRSMRGFLHGEMVPVLHHLLPPAEHSGLLFRHASVSASRPRSPPQEATDELLDRKMEYCCQKLRGVRTPMPESPKYHRTRIIRENRNARPSTPSDSSYYTASPNFIDKVILGRSIYIKHHCEEEANYSESEFVMDCLHWHNIFREKHDVPKLTLNNHLCSMAQFWANHLAHTTTFSHRNLRDIGENLFCKWSYIPDFDVTGQQVTKYWYEEIKVYNFFQKANLLHIKAGHFTQIVWKSSTEFGVGKARSRCGKVIVVANYRPAGNIIGEFEENVLRPINDMDILNEIV